MSKIGVEMSYFSLILYLYDFLTIQLYLQADVYPNMEEEISGTVLASAISSNVDELSSVDIVRVTNGTSK